MHAIHAHLPESSVSPERGFTLIELMIVVGIIGILVAVAIPNFSRYQSKARQSEAKIALAAIYTSEKSFYSEYSAYIASFDAIGYAPEGARRYYSVGWSASTGTVTGYTGGIANASWANLNNSFLCTQTTQLLAPAVTLDDRQTFTVAAAGCIRQGTAKFDAWNMDETKTLANNNISL